MRVQRKRSGNENHHLLFNNVHANVKEMSERGKQLLHNVYMT